jgi:hypothetical protein
MPAIKYNETGAATVEQMDAAEMKAREWANGADKRLFSIEKRYDVEAIAVRMEWTVPAGEVGGAMTTADDVISQFDGDLPLPSEVATVEYTP